MTATSLVWFERDAVNDPMEWLAAQPLTVASCGSSIGKGPSCRCGICPNAS
jgi:hypothetical protein